MAKEVIMAVIASITYVALMMIQTLPLINGHGMMIEPAMRSSLWRFDYQGAEPNYNDNGLNCGGFTNLHERQNGRCGVCGDPFQGPRDNEAGGKYAKGIIARTYKAGQYITVVSDITANHDGYIELRLCPHNDLRTPVTQQCLNQNLLPIKGHGTRYHLLTNQKSNFKIRHTVKLPDYVTCRQCVLQWYWKAGQHSGIDPVTNVECKGCGKQEEFINCADIAITDEFGMFPSPNTVPPQQVTTAFPMYGASSYMFNGQGIFPDYFDDYNSYFTTPSYFDSFSRQFVNSRNNFGPQQRNHNFGPTQMGIPPQRHAGGHGHLQQNMGDRRPGMNQDGFNTNMNSQIRLNQNEFRNSNTNQRTGIIQNKFRYTNTNPRRGFNQNSFPGPIRNTNNANRNFERNPHTNRGYPPPRNSRPLIDRNTRPFISRNNRPGVDMNRNIRGETHTNRHTNNNMNAHVRHNGPLRNMNPRQTAHVMRASEPNDSDMNDVIGDLIDDEDLFMQNTAFWADFNRLLNLSSPETKQSLYEIADDADNLEEFHQNIQLLLQMQGNHQASQTAKESDSEESLDMDWLMTEAKNMKLDSDEQNLLGLYSNEENSQENENTPSSTEHKKKDMYEFEDENRIRDETDSDGSFSDGFDKTTEEVSSKHDLTSEYSDESVPTSDDFNKDYDSENDNIEPEIKVDSYINRKSATQQSFHRQSEERDWENGNTLYPKSKDNSWNDNVLYKTDVLDYDDKDVFVEGDNPSWYGENKKVESSEVIEDKITINYLESPKTLDYSDSENIDEGNIDDDNFEKWEDSIEDTNVEKEDYWSDEKGNTIIAKNVVITAKGKSIDSEENAETEKEQDIAMKGEKTDLEQEPVENENKEVTEIQSIEDNNDINSDKSAKDEQEHKKKENDANDDANKETGDQNEQSLEKLKSITANSETMKEDISIDDNTVTTDLQNAQNDIIENSIKQEIVPKMDDIAEKSQSLMSTSLQKMDDIAEKSQNLMSSSLHKMEDVAETSQSLMSTSMQNSKIGDDPNEPPKISSDVNVFVDNVDRGQNFGPVTDVIAMNQFTGMPPQFQSIDPRHNNGYSNGNTVPRLASSMTGTPDFGVNQRQTVSPSSLSSFRKKIKDRITKTMSHETTQNGNKHLNIISTDRKDSNKHLSPSLSKLVLKMFMNTKTTKTSCPGLKQPSCTPVKLWSKYQQVSDWCNSLCPYGNCPSAVCSCTCESSSNAHAKKNCRGQTAFQEKSGEIDKWCQKTCSEGNCPDLLCVCS